LDLKETVRARLRRDVKRILNRYGYPPDMQLLATENVLKQAELMANELMMQLKNSGQSGNWLKNSSGR